MKIASHSSNRTLIEISAKSISKSELPINVNPIKAVFGCVLSALTEKLTSYGTTISETTKRHKKNSRDFFWFLFINNSICELSTTGA